MQLPHFTDFMGMLYDNIPALQNQSIPLFLRKREYEKNMKKG